MNLSEGVAIVNALYGNYE